MRADNTIHLITAAHRRHELTRAKAIRALRELDQAGNPVTFETIAREAEVSRSWLYTQPDIKDEIHRLRALGNRTPNQPTPTRQRATESSLLRRLEIANNPQPGTHRRKPPPATPTRTNARTTTREPADNRRAHISSSHFDHDRPPLITGVKPHAAASTTPSSTQPPSSQPSLNNELQITMESTFATVRHRTKVTKGPGSRAAGLAMAFKLIEAAQSRWRAVNAPHLVALVRAGARFESGKLVERPAKHAESTAA
jgi:hypothetical protein